MPAAEDASDGSLPKNFRPGRRASGGSLSSQHLKKVSSSNRAKWALGANGRLTDSNNANNGKKPRPFRAVNAIGPATISERRRSFGVSSREFMPSNALVACEGGAVHSVVLGYHATPPHRVVRVKKHKKKKWFHKERREKKKRG